MDASTLLILFIIAISNSQNNKLTRLNFENSYLSNMEVDRKYTLEKIKIIKEIGPYLPMQYIPLINKSVLITEKIVKITELAEFMKESDHDIIKEAIEINNNKDRLNKIINVIQKEATKSEVKNMGTILDLIVNIDKYKNMMTILSSVMNTGDLPKDPSKLIDIIAPLINPDNNADKEKIKEMNKMMEIFKLLNTSKPTSPIVVDKETKE